MVDEKTKLLLGQARVAISHWLKRGADREVVRLQGGRDSRGGGGGGGGGGCVVLSTTLLFLQKVPLGEEDMSFRSTERLPE